MQIYKMLVAWMTLEALIKESQNSHESNDLLNS